MLNLVDIGHSLINKLRVYSPWDVQEITHLMGYRITLPSGNIKSATFYPVVSLAGSPCSILLGFEKGQVLKYNLNKDRISGEQTNVTHYSPIMPNVKTGYEPTFPLEHKKVLQYATKKIENHQEMHEYRQFFDHHNTSIIAILFFGIDEFITVDKNLKCAIWCYRLKEGNKCYKPTYQFQIVSHYKIYKQAENPRFAEIFPSSKIESTPTQLYATWMRTQTYLRHQIYNNPKKQIAYFKSPMKEQNEPNEQAIWKIAYDETNKKVNRIYESCYDMLDGNIEGKNAQIWNGNLILLVQREHVMRLDLKTIKIYSWNIQLKKLGLIGIEFDIFKSQQVSGFQISEHLLPNIELPILAIISSGRILLFSMLSGQMLKNLADIQFLADPKHAKEYFTSIACDRQYFAAATTNNVMEINLKDDNSSEAQIRLKDMINQVKKKSFNF